MTATVATVPFLLLPFFSCLVGARLSVTVKDQQQHTLVQLPLIPHTTILKRQRRRELQEIINDRTPPVNETDVTVENQLVRSAVVEDQDGDNNVRSSTLYQGLGTHYVDLWIGTPAQRQTVIVDTGSSIAAVPCSECADCGAGEYHTDFVFHEEDSSSFTEVSDCDDCVLSPKCDKTSYKTPRCIKRNVYAEGSGWLAHEVIDRVYLGGPSHEVAPSELLDDATYAKNSFMFRFGCQTKITGLFKTQLADGIMGMDRSDAVSKGKGKSFWKQAYDANAMDNEAFSLCFSHSTTALMSDYVSGIQAGVLTLGGTNSELHETPIIYASMDPNLYPNLKDFYAVRIQKMYLRSGNGGESVIAAVTAENSSPITYQQLQIDEGSLNAGGMIVDSGTTMTELPSALKKPFQDAYKAIMGQEWYFAEATDDKQAIAITQEEFNAMPTIILQLEAYGSSGGDNCNNAGINIDDNSVLVAFPPSHYLEYLKKTDDGSKFEFASLIDFNIAPVRNGILGANFMMGHEILFDVANQRLGIAESSCNFQTISSIADAAVKDGETSN